MAEPDERAVGADRVAFSRVRPEAFAAPRQHGPAPFTPADLRAALAWAFPGAAAHRDAVYADALPDFDRADVLWNGDVALLVALLSPAHAEGVRAHLGWSPEAMAAALARVRAEYPR